MSADRSGFANHQPDRWLNGNPLRTIRNTRWLLGWGGVAIFVFLFPLAFVNHEIYVDEGWLGQQAHSLITNGAVFSEFFRDMPPLDHQIVIYHKLLIWAGASLIYVAGWGLYTLRTVSLLAGLMVIGLLFFCRSFGSAVKDRFMAVLVLMFTPLFVTQAIIFRPEMMVVAFGFGSFWLLEQGLSRNVPWLILLSGFAAGLSGSAHAIGLAYATAGFVMLLAERRFRLALIFAATAALGFFPYISGYFFSHQLFMEQGFHNKLVSPNFSLSWWQPFVSIAEEHKRWFRKPEVIGISVLFLLALTQTTAAEFRERRRFWTYFAVLVLIIAAAPVPKITRYVLPLLPFFALVIAERFRSDSHTTSGWRRVGRGAFLAWGLIFFAYGFGWLVNDALVSPSRQISTNRQLGSHMKDHSLVMAPFDFVFNEQPRFVIQSFRGARYAGRHPLSARQLEQYADSLGVQFMIFSPEEITDWNLDTTNLDRCFTRYEEVKGTTTENRWLVVRRPR